MEQVKAFNHGFDGDSIAANFTMCTNHTLWTSFIELPIYNLKSFRYGDYYDIIYNTTMQL